MDRQQQLLRFGAAVIIGAVLLRLAGNGFFRPVFQFLGTPDVASLLLYLETGRRVQPVQQTEAPETQPQALSTIPQETVPAPKPIFTPADAERVSINYRCSYRPDIGALLQTPLNWDLFGEAPSVLIVHTHTTESYTPTAEDTYMATAAYRTLEEDANMVSIGQRVAQILEEGGVRVIHDRTLHDYPSYNGSYTASRETVERYLAQYPTICLVLDLHRDAAEDASGKQVATMAQVEGQESAQLMLVMGSDAGGLTYPDWEKNLALAVKLQAQLEQMYPGVCRKLQFCGQRYNQDLLPGFVLVEVGTAGNTRQQALTAAEALARGILALGAGTG